MANGADGNIWFTEEAGNSIDQINIATGAITRFPIPDKGGFPQAIAVGADGSVWFCENSARIGVMTTSGVFSGYPLPFACNALAATSDGSIWANGGNEIQRIESGGGVSQFPLPSGRSPLKLAVGSDGNVWFTELPHCPPSCFGRRMFGTITLGGSITEFNWFHKHSGFTGDMVLGHDGNLYTIYGNDGRLVRISMGGSILDLRIFAAPTAVVLVAGAPGVFDELSRRGGLYEGGPTVGFNFLGYPPDGNDFASHRDLVFGSDGNLWMTQANLNRIAVYLRHRIKPTPTEIVVSIGHDEHLSVREQSYSQSWQVVSTDPTIATVQTISPGQYDVTGIAAGSCSISITDSKNNHTTVPVTVTQAK